MLLGVKKIKYCTGAIKSAKAHKPFLLRITYKTIISSNVHNKLFKKC
jgi:hypothetical protein